MEEKTYKYHNGKRLTTKFYGGEKTYKATQWKKRLTAKFYGEEKTYRVQHWKNTYYKVLRGIKDLQSSTILQSSTVEEKTYKYHNGKDLLQSSTVEEKTGKAPRWKKIIVDK